jgi:hypothetical protein
MRKVILAAALVALVAWPAACHAHGIAFAFNGRVNARFISPFITVVRVTPFVYGYGGYGYGPPIVYGSAGYGGYGYGYAAPACQPAAAPPPCSAPVTAPATSGYVSAGYGFVQGFGVLPLYSYLGAVYGHTGFAFVPFTGHVFATRELAVTHHVAGLVPGLAGRSVQVAVRAGARREVVRVRAARRPVAAVRVRAVRR